MKVLICEKCHRQSKTSKRLLNRNGGLTGDKDMKIFDCFRLGIVSGSLSALIR